MYVIITRDQCTFCDTAKALLRSNNQQYVEYNVQSPSSKWVLTLMKKCDMRTVPQIFKPDGTHVGGCKELEEFLLETCKKEV